MSNEEEDLFPTPGMKSVTHAASMAVLMSMSTRHYSPDELNAAVDAARAEGFAAGICAAAGVCEARSQHPNLRGVGMIAVHTALGCRDHVLALLTALDAPESGK